MFLRSLLLVCTLALLTSITVAGEAPADAAPKVVVASTHYFELRSDPRVGLHHFLIAWASVEAGEWPPYARPLVAERDTWRLLLDEQEQTAWSAALEAYKGAVGRSYVFDMGMVAVRDWAAGVAEREAVPAVDGKLADALEAALPIYTRYWWPAHDASNRAWIESVAPSLAAIERSIIPRLEAAYGGRWPEARISIDTVVFANDVGAYCAGSRVTI